MHIGRGFSIPSEAATQTFGIVAIRGGGKTYTALVLAEELLKARLQTIVVDPTGVCWGLRVSPDGKPAGLPVYIFGGEYGDIALDNQTPGDLIADFIVEKRVSVVLDLSDLRKKEQARFMTDFGERLYYLKRRREKRSPVHVILDEADSFAPQRPFKGEERMLGAMEDLVRRGRSRGIGVTLVTQRPAVINKNVLTQVETLVSLRLTAPQDIDAIDAWIERHALPGQREAYLDSVTSLPNGTAWFWSPGWLRTFEKVKVRLRDTFDSSATPKVDEKTAAAVSLAEVDISNLKGELAEAAKRKQESDPKIAAQRLQVASVQIAQLQAEIERLRSSLSQVKTQVREVVRQVPVTTQEDIDRLMDIAEHVRVHSDGVRERLAGLAEEIGHRAERMEQEASRSPVTVAQGVVTAVRERAPLTIAPKLSASTLGRFGRLDEHALSEIERMASSLKAGGRRMIGALAIRYPVTYTRSQLATLSGFAARGGTFKTYFGVAKREGLLAERDGHVEITDNGRQFAAAIGVEAPVGLDVIEMWRSRLKAGERAMVDVLVAIWPNWISREELARRSGKAKTFTGGTFKTYLGVLVRNGLAEKSAQNVRAGPALELR